MERLFKKIFADIRRFPNDINPYNDYFQVIRAAIDGGDKELALGKSGVLRELCTDGIRKNSKITLGLVDLSKKTLLFESPHYLDSYLQYLEINRKPHEKFYIPRKKQLYPIAMAFQDLADDKLDELYIILPPRVGKTSLLMFFYTWIIGRNSELSNLYSAFSDTITSAMYTGILEILEDNHTYTWNEIFPAATIASTNAKNQTLNIDRVKRYPSMTCRSLYGTLNGACDCNGFLAADDLIGGIEEAVNPDRLNAAWLKTDNNLIPRAKEMAKLIFMGTRWSMIDPQGRRMEVVKNSPEYKNRRHRTIAIPALDRTTDESNFEYRYGVGYSTEFYRQRRASFERNNDMASWAAQYMGDPIEREGTLFLPEDMKFYNGILPEVEPDRIFMAVDPSWGGGDFVSAPICYEYDGVGYIDDVVFNSGEKNVTQPEIVKKIIDHQVEAARFEGTKATASYKQEVEERLNKAGYRLNITTKAAPSDKGKASRIFDKAPEIRELYFREEGKRSKEYSMFMQNLFSFKMFGKNKNDDAADSLAMLIDMKKKAKSSIRIFDRPF